MIFTQWLAIGLGGALGAVARAALGLWLNPKEGGALPWGTFAANLLGSLALGFLVGLLLSERMTSPTTRALLATGFCGAFTTFSTFSMETVNLARNGHALTAVLYVGLTLALCLVGSILGLLYFGKTA
jgi:CrcB protein